MSNKILSVVAIWYVMLFINAFVIYFVVGFNSSWLVLGLSTIITGGVPLTVSMAFQIIQSKHVRKEVLNDVN